jgi:CBS domain containing-hemolysin-like protein
MTADQALDAALATPHTRFPVLDERGGVVGVVHLADVARGARDAPDEPIRTLARPPIVVPERKPLDELLDELRRGSNPLAIVVDEYGDFAGVLSVEDIVEEIVGEIADERDPEPDVRLGEDGTILARGHVALADLRDHDVDLEDPHATSIGGLVLNELGRPAKVGDTVQRNGREVTVRNVRGTRILDVGIAPGRAGPPAETARGRETP